MTGGKDWGRRRAPDLGDFEELAAQAWARLPRAFRDLCGDVVVRVEDFATEEVLRELSRGPFDLMPLPGVN
jgi:predicted Zn-dependent protease with MMP-like domain